MHLLVTWLIWSLAVWITAQVIPGFRVEGFGGAIVVAAIFGVLNFLLGWFFYTIIVIGTLGIGWLLSFLTHWVVNAILLKITDALSSRLTIRSFGTAFLAGLIMTVLGSAGERVLLHGL